MKVYPRSYQKILFFILCTLTQTIFALNAPEPEPEKRSPEPIYTCEPKNYNFMGQGMVLNTDKKESDQQLFLIQNISEYDVWVNHAPTQASMGASAGWSSKLLKDHWSAMALNQKEVSFQCMRNQENVGFKPLSCKRVLRICRATSPAFGKGTSGSYWVIENQISLKNMLEQLQQRGINLAAQ